MKNITYNNCKLFAIILAFTCLIQRMCGSTAICPQTYSAIETWEPYNFHLGNTQAISLIDRTVVEGYFLYCRCRDTTPNDNNIGNCSRREWDVFPQLTDIGIVNTHGDAGHVTAVAFKNDSTGEVAAHNWMDSGTDNNDMQVVQQVVGIGEALEYTNWVVRVYTPWFERNWKPIFKSNKSIVVMAACFSADNGPIYPSGPVGPSITYSVGGRVVFGWTDLVLSGTISDDVAKLMDNMNGTEPNSYPGYRRKAGEAYNAVYTGGGMQFRKLGNNDTTLCPSVEKRIFDNVCPIQGAPAGWAGDGWIVFDTELVTSPTIAATDALKFQVLQGSVIISDIHWTGNNRIDFKYKAEKCEGDYLVEVTAVARKIIGSSIGQQQLDGGTWASNGTAPNADDFVWHFSP